MDVCELSAVDLSAALRRRELSAVDALEAVLQRTDEIAGTVNPFSARLTDRARRAVRTADQRLARGTRTRRPGPLCGVPVSTKVSPRMAGIDPRTGRWCPSTGSPSRSSPSGSSTATLRWTCHRARTPATTGPRIRMSSAMPPTR